MSTDAITKKGVLESQAPAPFDVEDTLSVHEEPGKSKGGKAHSMAIAVFAMCCAMIGSGIVGLPSAMAKLSFYIGVPALMFASVATGYTGITLGYIAQNTRKLGNGGYIESYPAIGKVLYGPKVESFVLFVQWINVYSVSMLYLILAAMNMNLLVPSIHAKYWTLIIGGIILPFSWIKTFREMLSVTAFGFFASLILVISVLAEDAAFTHDAKIPTSSEYGNISIKSVFQGWGTIVFAFGGHCLFIDMVRSMPNKSVFKNSVIVGYTITTALYLVVACTCYGLYGQQLQSEGKSCENQSDHAKSTLSTASVEAATVATDSSTVSSSSTALTNVLDESVRLTEKYESDDEDRLIDEKECNDIDVLSTGAVEFDSPVEEEEFPGPCLDEVRPDCQNYARQVLAFNRIRAHGIPQAMNEPVVNTLFSTVGGTYSVMFSQCEDDGEKRNVEIVLKRMIFQETLDLCTEGFEVDGKEINFVGERKSDTLLCIWNLPSKMKDEELNKIGKLYGDVGRAFVVRSLKTGESKCYGFVEYEKKAHAESALKGIVKKIDSRKRQSERPCSVEFYKGELSDLNIIQSKVLIIDHVPTKYRGLIKLQNAFESHGKVLFIKIVPDPFKSFAGGRDIGVVQFSDWESAEHAKCAMNNTKFPGTDNLMRLSYAEPNRTGSEVASSRAIWGSANKKNQTGKVHQLAMPISPCAPSPGYRGPMGRVPGSAHVERAYTGMRSNANSHPINARRPHSMNSPYAYPPHMGRGPHRVSGTHRAGGPHPYSAQMHGAVPPHRGVPQQHTAPLRRGPDMGPYAPHGKMHGRPIDPSTYTRRGYNINHPDYPSTLQKQSKEKMLKEKEELDKQKKELEEEKKKIAEQKALLENQRNYTATYAQHVYNMQMQQYNQQQQQQMQAHQYQQMSMYPGVTAAYYGQALQQAAPGQQQQMKPGMASSVYQVPHGTSPQAPRGPGMPTNQHGRR
eukprot:Nk52_evm27s1569 gene=Nk52_evmTU27s1569